MFPLPAGPEVILTDISHHEAAARQRKLRKPKHHQLHINLQQFISLSSLSSACLPACLPGSRWVHAAETTPPPGSSSSPRLFFCSSLPLIKLATKCPGHRLPRPRKEPWRREDVGARLCVVAPVVVPEDPRLPACTHKHTHTHRDSGVANQRRAPWFSASAYTQCINTYKFAYIHIYIDTNMYLCQVVAPTPRGGPGSDCKRSTQASRVPAMFNYASS